MVAREILIKAPDIISGTEYACVFTGDQAERIMTATIDELISLGSEGAWVWVRNAEIAITYGKGEARVFLEKDAVLNQIEEQLLWEEPARAGIAG